MSERLPSPALFFETINAYQRSAALKTGIELKLFTAIGAGCTTAKGIAERCGVAEKGARVLADYLTTAGFLTKRNGEYGLTPDSAMFLDEKSQAYAGAAVEFLASPKLHANFEDLTSRVRRGGAPPEEEKALEEGHDMWVRFARGMGGLMFGPAQIVAKQVLKGSTGAMKVLDIAASHGMYGLAFAMQNPQAEVVGQDFPNVLEVAKQNAQRFGVAARYHGLPGDALKVEFGGDFDVVLLPNILHHFNVGTCEGLLRKVHGTLKPGGRAVLVEFIPNEDRVSPPVSSMFSLVMLANTAAGDAYTYPQFQSMLKNAGFGEMSFSVLGPGMQEMVIATR
ncbi:MAG: methyltransferase [Phycisphaerae bacterium]